MALTNRHRLSILIGFLVISEIFYITLMIKIPDDIMEREKAQSFVEQVGKYIPKIANLQKLAQRDVVPDVMPFYYAVVCLWCLSVGTLVMSVFRLYYLFDKEKNWKNIGMIKAFLYLFGSIVLCICFVFLSPLDSDSIYSQIGVLYIPKSTAAIFGAIMNTFLYLGFLIAIFRAYPVVKYYTVKGDNV